MIETFKDMDKEIYPIATNFTFHSDKSSLESLESIDSSTNTFCKICKKSTLDKNFGMSTVENMCNICYRKKSVKNKINVQDEYYKLDPSGTIRTAVKYLNEFDTFDKNRNLTQEQFVQRNMELENKVDYLLRMVDKLSRLSMVNIPDITEHNELPVKEMYLYLLDFGLAEKIIPSHFKVLDTFPLLFDHKKKTRVLKYGVSDDIDKVIVKYNTQFRYSYDSIEDHIKFLMSNRSNEYIIPAKENTFLLHASSIIRHIKVVDKADSSNNFEDKIILCDDVNLKEVMYCLKYI
jgi:hypothetical protein